MLQAKGLMPRVLYVCFRPGRLAGARTDADIHSAYASTTTEAGAMPADMVLHANAQRIISKLPDCIVYMRMPAAGAATPY